MSFPASQAGSLALPQEKIMLLALPGGSDKDLCVLLGSVTHAQVRAGSHAAVQCLLGEEQGPGDRNQVPGLRWSVMSHETLHQSLNPSVRLLSGANKSSAASSGCSDHLMKCLRTCWHVVTTQMMTVLIKSMSVTAGNPQRKTVLPNCHPWKICALTFQTHVLAAF